MIDSAPAMIASCQTGSSRPTRGKTIPAKRGAITIPPTNPAVLPDQVFPGLTVGASLGPPNALPPNIAAVSQTQVTTSGKKTNQAPVQERTGYCACRMA